MTITCCPSAPFHYVTCNGHVMGYVIDVITCITCWSLLLCCHYKQHVMDVITCITWPITCFRRCQWCANESSFNWHQPTPCITYRDISLHLDSFQNSDIGARDPISVYPDVGSDIGALFVELRYRSSCDIGVFRISGTMISE